jgi:hypothetical protein
VNTFICIWIDTIIYSLFPFLILAVLFFMPDKFDSLIPKRSKIILGKKPLIIIKSEKNIH